MRSDRFGSQLDRKCKTWFFTFLNVYVSWTERDKILISQLTAPKFMYFAEQNGPKGGPHENEFWKVSNTKMNIKNKKIRAQKVDEKNGVICLISFFHSWVMVLKLPKIVHFLQICPDLSKKSKFIKTIYIHQKDLIMLFQRTVCFIKVWATAHEMLRIKISK